MTVKELEEIPLLATIDGELLKNHLSTNLLKSHSYTKGATVHNQNTTCETLDLVLSGETVAYTLGENGSATVMFKFPKGSLIGANLLFSEHASYPLNIYCSSSCKILHIQKKAVEDYLKDYDFVMAYIKSLSWNSQNMNRRISLFSQKNLRTKILAYLEQQQIIQKSTTITLPMSKKELADYLGVQRPSLFRELKNLTQEGQIQVEKFNKISKPPQKK